MDKITFPLRITAEMRDAITEAAYISKVSKQQLCQDAIRAWIEKVLKEALLQ